MRQIIRISWLLVASACGLGSETAKTEQVATSFTPAQVLGFEDAGAWTGPGIAGVVDTPRTEGSAALAVDPQSYSLYQSVPFAQTGIPREVTFDLYQPTTQPNPYWFGAAQLFLECPAHDLYNAYVGQVALTDKPLGTYTTLAFPVPAAIQAAAASCPALTVKIALNVSGAPGTYYLDRLDILTDLILHYSFDDDAAPGADSSGYGRDGTLVGGAALGAGRDGTGLVLDGVSSYVELPSGITDGLNEFTVTAWVNMAEARPWARLFDFGGDAGFT